MTQLVTVKGVIAERLRSCKLELHENKTKVVCCKDGVGLPMAMTDLVIDIFQNHFFGDYTSVR